MPENSWKDSLVEVSQEEQMRRLNELVAKVPAPTKLSLEEAHKLTRWDLFRAFLRGRL